MTAHNAYTNNYQLQIVGIETDGTKILCVFFPAGVPNVYVSPATLRCFHNTSTLSWCFTSTEIVWLIRDGNSVLNSFTAPACKLSRLKTAHTHANRFYNKSNFNIVRFDENPFTC